MEKVEYYFREISKIPRGSYNEKAICDYVENFAKERNIKYVRDKMHNIVLFKEATKGYEDHETVMLEGHMDMVCEKNKLDNKNELCYTLFCSSEGCFNVMERPDKMPQRVSARRLCWP